MDKDLCGRHFLVRGGQLYQNWSPVTFLIINLDTIKSIEIFYFYKGLSPTGRLYFVHCEFFCILEKITQKIYIFLGNIPNRKNIDNKKFYG